MIYSYVIVSIEKHDIQFLFLFFIKLTLNNVAVLVFVPRGDKHFLKTYSSNSRIQYGCTFKQFFDISLILLFISLNTLPNSLLCLHLSEESLFRSNLIQLVFKIKHGLNKFLTHCRLLLSIFNTLLDSIFQRCRKGTRRTKMLLIPLLIIVNDKHTLSNLFHVSR